MYILEKHAKSEIEFTWGKIGWSKRGIVSKTQTNAQTDVLRSANEQTLINYIQTMAASAPEQSTHFKSTGLPRLLGNIIILIVNLVWFLFFPLRGKLQALFNINVCVLCAVPAREQTSKIIRPKCRPEKFIWFQHQYLCHSTIHNEVTLVCYACSMDDPWLQKTAGPAMHLLTDFD